MDPANPIVLIVCLERLGDRHVHREERREGGPDRRDPTWAKLIDFQTTLPSAVAELVRQRDQRQRA